MMAEEYAVYVHVYSQAYIVSDTSTCLHLESGLFALEFPLDFWTQNIQGNTKSTTCKLFSVCSGHYIVVAVTYYVGVHELCKPL